MLKSESSEAETPHGGGPCGGAAIAETYGWTGTWGTWVLGRRFSSGNKVLRDIIDISISIIYIYVCVIDIDIIGYGNSFMGQLTIKHWEIQWK